MDFFSLILLFVFGIAVYAFGKSAKAARASLNSPNQIETPNSSKQDLGAFESGLDDYLPEVVGESHYRSAFDKIRNALALRIGDEANVQVELVTDPKNPYSESGMAVAVFVMGEKVGHISEDYAPEVFEYLDTLELGGRQTFPGRIYFGNRDLNSVQLLEFDHHG